VKKISVIFILFMSSIAGFAQDKTLPYTLDDRERLIRLEGKTENLEKKLDAGFSDLKQQINILFGACMALIIALIGFIFWDRRTAMQPQTEAMRTMQAKLDALQKELTAKGIL
jgi:cytochrome b subunit of formate dehydrogenase